MGIPLGMVIVGAIMISKYAAKIRECKKRILEHKKSIEKECHMKLLIVL